MTPGFRGSLRILMPLPGRWEHSGAPLVPPGPCKFFCAPLMAPGPTADPALYKERLETELLHREDSHLAAAGDAHVPAGAAQAPPRHLTTAPQSVPPCSCLAAAMTAAVAIVTVIVRGATSAQGVGVLPAEVDVVLFVDELVVEGALVRLVEVRLETKTSTVTKQFIYV